MKNEQPVLVILSPGFPRNEGETDCLPTQQLFVKAINENFPGLQIVVLALEYPFTKVPYKWYGNTVIPFDGWSKGALSNLRLWLSVMRTLATVRKTKNIIGMISFWFSKAAWMGSHFARRNGIRHIAWISGQDAREENKYIKRIKPKPEELAAMSSFLSDEFSKNHGIRPAYIVPNAIEESKFPPLSNGRSIDILGVGSLIGLKQYDIFLSVVHSLKNFFPVIKVVHCGEGPERKKIGQAIKDLQLEDCVSLLGKVSHEEVLGLMQHSKILLHTSSYEGFSTVCLEALYAGAHVISFCDPMNSPVNHWHIAEGKEDMLNKAGELVMDKNLDHSRVLIHSMKDTALKYLELFGVKPGQ